MKNTAQADVELHELFDGRLKIFQKKHGYRFSIDAILLANFVIEAASGTVADLGTGSGVLPVILARHKKFKKIIGIEIQEDLAELALKNIALHECGDRAAIIHADLRSIAGLFSAEEFDTVITNPPFYSVPSGRINSNSQRAAARHEMHGTLQDFLAAAAFLLKQAGRFIAVYRPSRFSDLIAGMRLKNLEPKTLQLVYPRATEGATMVLVEGIKGAGTEMKILPPLILYDAQDRYTGEVKNIFNKI